MSSRQQFIGKITIIVYLFVDLEENEFDDFCFRTLTHSPIYNTLKRSMEFVVKFKKLV
jgi:hypothetical protein